MSVAVDYPARRQPDGTYWYRPVRDKGIDATQWGWTHDPNQAHEDYQCQVCFGHPSTCDCAGGPSMPDPANFIKDPKPPTTEENTMTDATDLGIAPPQPRVTQWAEYPLPPMLPRPRPKFNQYGHYLMPDPVTGLPVGFVRATTVAKTLDDTYNLSRWTTRTQCASVLKLVDYAADGNQIAIDMLAELRKAIENGNGSTVNSLIDRIDDYNGGKHSAEFGDAVHEWCAAIDTGMVLLKDVPEMFRPWVDAYRATLARHGLIAVAEYVERLVLNDNGIERVVGTLDRIFKSVSTGELFLGDLKTSKADNVKWSWLTWPVQLSSYARARLMWGLDEKWAPMPALNPDMGLLVHLPSDSPKQSHLLPMRLSCGDDYLETSLLTRAHRKNAKHDVPGLTTPVPSKEALRWVHAHQAVQAANSVSDLDAVWAEFQDVWSDELTELGHAVAKLFTATQ